MKMSCLALLVLILCSCSRMEPTVMTLPLNPQVAYHGVNIGRGARVELSLSDQRASKVLGKGMWRPTEDTPGLFADEKYVTNQDPKAILEKLIKDGLASLGFNVTTSGPVSNRLHVELEDINILNATGEARVALQVVIYRQNIELFDRLYVAEAHGIPRAFFKVEEPLNLAFADVVRQLLSDLEMLEALLTKHAQLPQPMGVYTCHMLMAYQHPT